MSDLVSILPGEIRKHFINMKNVRDGHDGSYAARLDELNGMAAEKNLFHSGWYLKQRSELKTQFADALAYGYMEEALATCKLYEVPLTRPFCASLEEAAKQMLTSFYRNIIHAQGTGAGFRMPASAVQAVNQQASNKRFQYHAEDWRLTESSPRRGREKEGRGYGKRGCESSRVKPPKRFAVGEHVRIINLGIDGVVTQVDDERTFMSQYMHTIDTSMAAGESQAVSSSSFPLRSPAPRNSSSATTYIQHINQSGPGVACGSSGDSAYEHSANWRHERIEARACYHSRSVKAQPNRSEADEVLGSLASAEKAAQSNDEHGVKHALSTITKGGWERVKKSRLRLATQVLLHYLKLHGMA